MSARALVLGGGVAGLFSAWELARAGWRVTVLDVPHPGMASWAGGGILGALTPWDVGRELAALFHRGAQRYPALAEELGRETGMDPELLASGALFVEPPPEALDWHVRTGEGERLDAAALATLEPQVRGRHALRIAGLQQVRSPRLLRALRARLAQLGVSLTQVEASDARLVRTGDGRAEVPGHGADAIVVAAGAWTATLLQPLGVRSPVRPVKGQMLLLQPVRAPVRHLVLKGDRYLIPRADGRVLVGSTLEDAGFDVQPTPEVRDELLGAARDLVPMLDVPPLQQWAGLRPATPDGLPILGPCPGLGNVWINSGHFRAGLTIAPACAELLAGAIARGTALPEAFSAARWA